MASKPREKTSAKAPAIDAGLKRRDLLLSGSSLLAASAVAATGYTGPAQAQQTVPTPAARSGQPPNILVIMGDDIGWFNIGAYHRGMMSGKTPNLDKLASQGMIFTDYYAEASCTAGRAAFITGEIPLRTGLTTVGQAGAEVGIPAQACTLATALKTQGYATGQFGKNHLGDLNKYLPTVHGFDEFFGYLYHLDAMSDPYWYSFPRDPAFHAKYGPRNLVHSWASDNDDQTVMPRWGKIGKQRIIDEGPLAPYPDMSNVPNMQEGLQKAKYDMTTFDEVLVDHSKRFMEKAKSDGKPFFLWHNTTRMHVWTFLSQKYASMMNSESNFGLEEAGMKQLDDAVGALIKHVEDIGEADNTIVIFTTDNGAEVFTWPDGGMTPFKGTKGTAYEGGFRAPCIIRWPGKVKPGTVQNGIFSALDWFPTLVTAAGNPNLTDQLLNGVKLGDRTYKNHLDGYDQTELLQDKGPSKRHEFFYFAGPQLGALRLDDFKFQFFRQPGGWPGGKVTTDMPGMVNIRQDPFERTPSINSENLNNLGGGYMNDFYAREFWRFVLVQQRVGDLAKTAIDYPPMQEPASFNLEAVKQQVESVLKNAWAIIERAALSAAPLARCQGEVALARGHVCKVIDVGSSMLAIDRRFTLSTLALPAASGLALPHRIASAQISDPLPSWIDPGVCAAVTREGSSAYVPMPERIATFDNDGGWGSRAHVHPACLRARSRESAGTHAPGMEGATALQSRPRRRP